MRHIQIPCGIGFIQALYKSCNSSRRDRKTVHIRVHTTKRCTG